MYTHIAWLHIDFTNVNLTLTTAAVADIHLNIELEYRKLGCPVAKWVQY